MHIWIAIASGLAAGLLFYVAARAVFGRKPDEREISQLDDEEVAQQAQPVARPTELSPEAQAFIDALKAQAPTPKPNQERLWTVDIWDSRKPQDHARGLPH